MEAYRNKEQIVDVRSVVEAVSADDNDAPLYQVESLCMRCRENVLVHSPPILSLSLRFFFFFVGEFIFMFVHVVSVLKSICILSRSRKLSFFFFFGS